VLARIGIALCICSLAMVAVGQAARSRAVLKHEAAAHKSSDRPSNAGERVRRVSFARPAPIRHLLLRVRPGDTVALHSRPGGPVVAQLSATTEFASPRVLGVVRTRGRWLGVTTTATANGRIAWVRANDPSVREGHTSYSLVASVKRRMLVLRRGSHVVRRFRVAVGRPGSPTPTGHFAVTDKLSGPRYGPYYGCCIVALSASQPHPPPGWHGGDRLAIHGTDAAGTIGTAASAGCLRATDADLRTVVRDVPLGTPVVVQR
jgi:lipoprotein-anchoring transpeptidase ErfK/SrfK